MTKNELALPVNKLRELIRLDPITGFLYWLPRDPESFSDGPRLATHSANQWNSLRSGKRALNSLTAYGYLCGNIGRKFFFAHRVAFSLANNRWPEFTIDHQNGIRTDNRPDNLRDVSSIENQRNKKTPITNKTGVIGVQWIADRMKWRAVIKDHGKKIHIGMFDSIDEAASARKLAEERLGFHRNHGRKEV